MHFLTAAQVRALAAFRNKDLDYLVVSPALHNPGWLTATFWMQDDTYCTMLITPEGELKYA